MPILLLITAAFIMLAVIIGKLLSSSPYRGPATDHFDGKHFHNPEPSSVPGPKELIRFMTGGPKEKWPKPETGKGATAPETPAGDHIRYLGHATFLLSIDGMTVLIDPVFRKAGPGGIFGPGRFRRAALSPQELPKIDLILVSHNHYDHFDVSAVKYLIRRDNPRLIMPPGCRNALPKRFRLGVNELDWWEEQIIGPLMVTSVPARHFSARGLFDRNRTGWCGFVLLWKKHGIFFAGDTAYGPHFREIGKRFPGLDAALLPIGAYRPEWMMQSIHINPADAVRAFTETDAKRMIACHHRTFRLAWEGPDTPEREMYEAAQERNLPVERVLAPLEGETITLGR